MPQVNKTALVPYSVEQMYQLVNGVEEYPQFLPWCGDSKVYHHTDISSKASITISKGAINKTFSTENNLSKNKKIEMKLINGPFKYLQGAWHFYPLQEDACKVSLNLEYEFSNQLIGLTIGAVFNQIANTLVDSFVKRANQVY